MVDIYLESLDWLSGFDFLRVATGLLEFSFWLLLIVGCECRRLTEFRLNLDYRATLIAA